MVLHLSSLAFCLSICLWLSDVILSRLVLSCLVLSCLASSDWNIVKSEFIFNWFQREYCIQRDSPFFYVNFALRHVTTNLLWDCLEQFLNIFTRSAQCERSGQLDSSDPYQQDNRRHVVTWHNMVRQDEEKALRLKPNQTTLSNFNSDTALCFVLRLVLGLVYCLCLVLSCLILSWSRPKHEQTWRTPQQKSSPAFRHTSWPLHSWRHGLHRDRLDNTKDDTAKQEKRTRRHPKQQRQVSQKTRQESKDAEITKDHTIIVKSNKPLLPTNAVTGATPAASDT